MVRRIGRTIELLVQARRRWNALAVALPRDEPDGPLAPLTGFGSNPGALRMYAYVPAQLAPEPALVVVLHGCTQTAAGYDLGAGWSTLADRFGFALLFPEQTTANNPKGCFNWFLPGDIARDRGEALSIRQGVERMIQDHGLDRRRVFVTGLSAGGAMAAVMLATYPDVFAGGAIVAGLPYGCASNVQEALQAMFQGGNATPEILGERVRSASPHRGPWPSVSIWHGTADTMVVPSNADQTLAQWLDVHGLRDAAPSRDTLDGYPRRVWRDGAGRAVVEALTITGMAHGTPLAVSSPDDTHGRAAPFMLDVGIASSLHIARFWGLTGWRSTAPAPAKGAVAPLSKGRPSRTGAEIPPPPRPVATPPLVGGIDINAVITKALRSAGLMKP